jgi:hypothetical protein
VNILFKAWKDLRRELVSTDDLEASKSARLLEAKEREMEYKMDLEKMMVRVQQQPTLFQRQTRVSLVLLFYFRSYLSPAKDE